MDQTRGAHEVSGQRASTRPSRSAQIVGWGSYVPERVVTNDELGRRIDTSDEWIMARTGIRERRFAAPHESTSTMGTRAAEVALQRAGLQAQDLDLIISASD